MLRATAGAARHFTLTRQGLGRWRPTSSPTAVTTTVERVGPLHAADPASPPLSLLARLEGFTPEHLEAAWLVEEELTLRPCPHGVPHLLPRRRGAIACGASPDEPQLRATLVEHGITDDELRDLTAAAQQLLRDRGALTAVPLAAALEGRGLRAPAGPLAETLLRLLWLRGDLESTGADGDGRVFAAPPDGPIERADTERARGELLTWYLGAFGPATVGDIAGWAGWTIPEVRSTVRAAVDVLEVEVEGWRERALLLGEDGERLAAAPPEADVTARLLPADDELLVAHPQTAARLASAPEDLDRRSAAGPAPVVLDRGTIAGTWSITEDRVLRLRPWRALSLIALEEAERIGALSSVTDIAIESWED